MNTVSHASPAVESELAEDRHAARETEVAQRIAEHQHYDAHHCRECGEVASGCVIGGTHLQVCDECLVCYVMTHITPGINVAQLA